MLKKNTATLLAIGLTVFVYFLLSGDLDKIHSLENAVVSLTGLFKVILEAITAISSLKD